MNYPEAIQNLNCLETTFKQQLKPIHILCGISMQTPYKKTKTSKKKKKLLSRTKTKALDEKQNPGEMKILIMVEVMNRLDIIIHRHVGGWRHRQATWPW
ncbi:hypothetical protein PFICI_02437 [Pestalotiopsis fici W106-1]|uniref:Uncharacterized protein n=1 Tax=Pestalotiopsis fici (strain W106-1 / CGMCC3.15140) TaxID=1229662 RepID=W3XG64_PESFW|nr:uncharacterized protein PFICI_02437 [Pestalotiopsis fici W106-1]ETS84412.1 hypothetical protein PFICI_02437 [Pestalotiopsis fici W106-1]